MAQNPDEPLTLTVHSLPRLDEGGAAKAVDVRAGRWKLFLLLLVSVAPVVASYFTYYVIRPEGRRNYGELIDPQRPLPAFSGTDAKGQSVPLTALKDQWLLISVADSACDKVCDEHLFVQRQLREGLGKEKERLDAKMAVAAPAGNAGQKQMEHYNRTYEQESSYSEMEEIGSQIEALEEMMKGYLEE